MEASTEKLWKSLDYGSMMRKGEIVSGKTFILLNFTMFLHSVEKREIYPHRKKNLTLNQLVRKAVAFTKYLWVWVNRLLEFLHCARYAKCKTFCSNFIICLLFFVKTFNSIPKMLGEGDGFFANCIRLKTASNLTIMMRISDTGIMQIFTKENYFLSKHF